jgi:anti-sigma factor RsiW
VSAPAACAVLAEELVAYLDGEQPEPNRGHIEAHVGTCLTCRRELERLRRARILLGALPAIEPSADFHDNMWRRLDAPLPHRRSRRRVVLWGAPALAAAAALALVWYSSVARLATDARGVHGAVASAPRPPAGGGSTSGDSRVATHQAAPGTDTPHDVAVAGSELEEYPPELIEHPELFLRYPVVRRLQKLQHFEEVRQHGEGEPLGSAPHEHGIGSIG